jgi:hypothetical protein
VANDSAPSSVQAVGFSTCSCGGGFTGVYQGC